MSAAAYPLTRMWTVPAGGSATIQSIIADTTKDRWVIYAAIRAGLSNAGTISWTDAGGQSGGYVRPSETAVLGDDLGSPALRDFVFKGTAGDVLHMTIGVSAAGVNI